MNDEPIDEELKKAVAEDLMLAHCAAMQWYCVEIEFVSKIENHPHYGAMLQAAMMSVLANKKTD